MQIHRTPFIACFLAAVALAGCVDPSAVSESSPTSSDSSEAKVANSTIGGGNSQKSETDEPRQRSFEFTYAATISGLKKGQRLRVWIPVPQSNAQQTVESLESSPEMETATDDDYGNQIAYFETTVDGDFGFSTKYKILRREMQGLKKSQDATQLNDIQRAQFLAPNKKVPLEGKQVELLNDIVFADEPLAIARTLYNRVDSHVKYDKSQPGYGNGDVLWVCDSRTGNCTDFHSLFISWARKKNIPARFEIGFPLPPERGAGSIGGYHCWAMFHTQALGWVPVDISEADKHPELKEYYFGNLTENRVTFSTGRDIELKPKQDGPALNYFVYPYAEADGQPLTKDNFELSFSYRDLETDVEE